MELVRSRLCLSQLSYILTSAVFIQGLKGETGAQMVIAVKAGEEAHLRCPLHYSKVLRQVMWQMILPEEQGDVTVASCYLLQDSHRHRLNPLFSAKLGLRGTTVRNCSIVVHNVTEQDERCYRCLFIAPFTRAQSSTVCLHIAPPDDGNNDAARRERSSPSKDHSNLGLYIGLPLLLVVFGLGAILWHVRKPQKDRHDNEENGEKTPEIKTPERQCLKVGNGSVLSKRPSVKKESTTPTPRQFKPRELFKEDTIELK